MQLTTYLNFAGRCEEAMEFYRRALGAEVTSSMRFKDSPPGTSPAGNENKIMHATVRIAGTELMASDGRCEGSTSFHGVSLSLTVANEAEANRVFAAIGEGGTVRMPLEKTFFSPRFGMVVDRFGLCWMVYVAPAKR